MRKVAEKLVLFKSNYANPPDSEGLKYIISMMTPFGENLSLEALSYLERLYTNEYYPKWPVILSYIKKVIQSEYPSATEAWVEVRQQIQYIGLSGGSVMFSNNLIHDTVAQLGGWYVICNSSGDYISTSFKNTYNQLLESKVEERMLNGNN